MRCGHSITLILLSFLLSAPKHLDAQDAAAVGKIAWQHGPASGSLGSQAKVNVPNGFVFADDKGAKRFMELTQNIPSGSELGVLAPDDLKWFVVFEFDETGYVKDDEKGSLDADAMLKTIQSATEKGNEERKRRGWGTLTVLDWMQPPHYDEITHNLEWSMKCQDDKGNLVANHNTRYLGRRGVMRISLVADTDALVSTLPKYRTLMSSFTYTPDNNYQSFVKGDKVAEYGLSALVVGGVAAVAAKSGLLKYLWKLIVVAVMGIGGWLKKLFSRKTQEPTQAL
jgi:uncharacterized membrane-anchored protein